MVWFSLSYFLFYGLYPSLIYKKVVKEGNHTILFYTYELLWTCTARHFTLTLLFDR